MLIGFMGRTYRLGKRQGAVFATREAILAAARELVASGSSPSLQAIARGAGVSRITVYNRFGSRRALLAALAPAGESPPPPRGPASAVERLRERLSHASSRWAAAPALYRHLPPGEVHAAADADRELAQQLAAENALRPGCSIKEAQDVIATLASFPTFDRLHQDGRRTAAAVADILVRMAGGILAS